MKIVYGFDDKKIIETIQQDLTDEGYSNESIICHTKMDVYKCAYEMNDIDCIILFENVSNETPWSALEIIKLVDFKNIQIIPIIRDKHTNNSEYLKLLYSSEIYNALIGKVNLKEVIGLIKKPRTKKEAKKYYNIDKCVLNLRDVTGRELDEVLGYLSRGSSEEDIASRFDNACAEFNDKQVESLLQKVNTDIKNACKKSCRYKALIGKKSEKPVEYQGVGNNNNVHDIDILYGFDSDEAISYLESILEREGYIIKSSRVKYNKEGIRNCVLKENINTVVVIENLERRGGYIVDEIVDLHEAKNINLIMLLNRDKKSKEFINELYCEGVTNALIGDNSAKEVVSLITKKRNRKRAREHYCLEIGSSCSDFVCSKHKNSIYVYWDKGIGELEDRYEFTKKIFSEEQIKEVIKDIPNDLRKKMEDADILNVKKRKPKKILFNSSKMLTIMGLCAFLIGTFLFGGYIVYEKIKINKDMGKNNTYQLVESDTTMEESSEFVYIPSKETMTQEDITDEKEATVENETTVEVRRKKKKRKIPGDVSETKHVFTRQVKTYYKPKERVTEKITTKQPEKKKPHKKQSKEKIEDSGSNREKIENYDSNKEIVE